MKRISLFFLALILLILTLLTLLVTTQSGLKLTIKTLNHFGVANIQTQELHGRLLGTMTARRITVNTGSNEWKASNFKLTFNPIPLLWNNVSISNVEMTTLTNKRLTSEPHGDSDSNSSSLTFSIRSANIQSLKLDLSDRLEKIEAQHIAWTGKINHDSIHFNLKSGPIHGLLQSMTASISGPLEHYQIDTTLNSDNLTVTGSGSGKGKSFNLLLLSQSKNSSNISGTASLNWEDTLSWNVSLQLQKISLQSLIKNGPYIHSLNSTISGEAEEKLSKLNWQINLKTDAGELASQGQYSPDQVAANWQLKAVNLQPILASANGILSSTGSWNKGITHGSFNLSHTSWQQWKTDELSASWDGNVAQKQINTFNLHTNNFAYKNKTLRSGTLNIQKTNKQQSPFHLTLHFNPGFYDTQSFTVAGIIGAKDQDLDLRINQAASQSLGTNWKLQKPFSLTHSKENWSVSPFCLFHQQDFFCASFRSDQEKWETHIQSKNAPLHHAMKSVKLKLPTNLDVSLKQQRGGPLLGKINASIDKATLFLTEHSIETQLHLKNSVLQAELLPQQIIFSSSSNWNNRKLWDISAELARENTPSWDWKSSALKASVYFDANELNFLNTFMESTELHAGTVAGKLAIQGTLSTPEITGDIRLNNIELLLLSINNKIKNLQGDIHFSGKKAKFNLTGSTATAPITLQGSAQFTQLKNTNAHFKLTSQGATLTNTKDYISSGDISLQGEYFANTLSLSGQVLISKATIKPANFSSATTLSEDVKIIGENQIKSWTPNVNVLVKLGDQVQVSSKRLSGKLGGELRLLKNDSAAWMGQGQIFMQDGKINDLDLDLKVANDSHVAYDNDPLGSPFVSIKLYRVIPSRGFGLNSLSSHNDLTVGLAMIGPYQNLEVKPYSQPTQLSQADILSYLLLGHPSNNSSAFNLASLLATASSLSSQNINIGLVKLMSIKKTLGFTELGVQSNLTLDALGTPYGSDESGFVVGRYITPRIYVRYISGISTLLNLLQIQYFMGHKWSLQLESGSVSANDVEGLDVLYHFTSFNQ